MSSTSTSSPPTSSSTSSSDSSDDSGLGSRGAANYFFGFLFLFAVILLVLVGCGIGTRRRLLSGRRANLQNTLGPWSLPGSGGEPIPPRLLETRLLVSDDPGWKEIMPLSAAYLSENYSNEKPAVDGLESFTTSTDRLSPASDSPFPTLRRTLLPPLRKPASNSTPKLASSPVTAIRVAILIAMPSPRNPDHPRVPSATGSDSEPVTTPAEVQIGVETLPQSES